MIGAAIAAIYGGWIRETTGTYTAAWYTAAILCVVAALSVLVLNRIPHLQAEKA
jgi:predicted MFS family arabinose efflux permease